MNKIIFFLFSYPEKQDLGVSRVLKSDDYHSHNSQSDFFLQQEESPNTGNWKECRFEAPLHWFYFSDQEAMSIFSIHPVNWNNIVYP